MGSGGDLQILKPFEEEEDSRRHPSPCGHRRKEEGLNKRTSPFPFMQDAQKTSLFTCGEAVRSWS